jgi:hypothetical protein
LKTNEIQVGGKNIQNFLCVVLKKKLKENHFEKTLFYASSVWK